MQSYYKLISQSSIFDRLRQLISDQGDKEWEASFAFQSIPVPYELVKLDTNLFHLMEKFNGLPFILRMRPMAFYPFHVDLGRLCTINMLLTDTPCETYFGSVSPSGGGLLDIDILNYDHSSYYLLNTQTMHSVINKNGYRDVLSIGFKSPNSFEIVRDYCVERKL